MVPQGILEAPQKPQHLPYCRGGGALAAAAPVSSPYTVTSMCLGLVTVSQPNLPYRRKMGEEPCTLRWLPWKTNGI